MSVNMVTMHNIRSCSFTHPKLPHSGFALQPLQERFYHRRIAANGGKSDPEARWGSSLYGVFLIPMGLFIAAWTSFPNIVWIAPIIGFTLFGIGFYMIITAILNYVCGFLNLHPLWWCTEFEFARLWMDMDIMLPVRLLGSWWCVISQERDSRCVSPPWYLTRTVYSLTANSRRIVARQMYLKVSHHWVGPLLRYWLDISSLAARQSMGDMSIGVPQHITHTNTLLAVLQRKSCEVPESIL